MAAPPAVDDQQLIAQAVKILAAGSAKQAFDLLEKPLQSRDPYTKSAAQFFAGHCLLKMNQVPRALDMWASIAKPLRDKPQSAHYFYAAKIEAMQLFVSGKARWPEKPKPKQVGHIIYRSNEPWRSLPDTLDDILNDPAIEARQAEAAILLAQLALRDKRPDLAERYYRRGLTMLQQFKPPPGYPELLEEKPRLEKELAARLAPYEAPERKKAQQIQKEQAIAAAERDLDPAIRQGNELWRQAEASAKDGQLTAALAPLRRLLGMANLKDHPRNDEAKYVLGKHLLTLGDRSAAFAQWDRALADDPAGPYRGQMLLDMADRQLFEEYDAPAAEKQLDRMAQIIQGLCPSPTGPPGSRPSENPNESATTAPAAGLAMALEIPPEPYAKLPRSWQQPFRSLVYRRSVLAWTKGDLALAVKSLEQSQALPAGPRLADFQDPYFATIVETDPAGGAGSVAQGKRWIKIRYGAVSPDATKETAVSIEAKKGNDPAKQYRTVFSVTWTLNFDADLDTDNRLRFPRETGGDMRKAGFKWYNPPDSKVIAGKMEAIMSFTPTGIAWRERGVEFVFGKDDAGNLGQCRFAREHKRAFARQDTLSLTREFPPFFNGQEQQFPDWTTDGEPDRHDTQYPSPARLNDKAFNIDAPGGDAQPSTKQIFIRQVFRNFMQWHDADTWQRMGPHAGWHFNASGRDIENRDGIAEMIADLPNEHGAGNDPTPMANAQPTCDVGDPQVVQQGEAVTLPGSATDDDTDVKGVSTGGFTEALQGLLGPDCPGLSASSVTRLLAIWQEEQKQWRQRSLAGKQYVYIWADGIHFNIRLEEDRQCILVLLGATPDGRKELIAVQDGYRESEQSWKGMLLDLKGRGLTIDPQLAVADGALGFWAACRQCWPKTREQRCWVHKSSNVLDKLPKRLHDEALDKLHQIWMAPGRAAALQAVEVFITLYAAKYAKAVECLLKDRGELLAFYDFPAEHWLHLRTTNPIESTFATVRHRHGRTKGNGSRAACLAMVFKLCESAQKHWRRLNGHDLLADVIAGVTFTDGEKTQAA